MLSQDVCYSVSELFGTLFGNPLGFSSDQYIDNYNGELPFWMVPSAYRQNNILDIQTLGFQLTDPKYLKLVFQTNSKIEDTEPVYVKDYIGPNGCVYIERDIYDGNGNIPPFIVERIIAYCPDDENHAIVYYTVVQEISPSEYEIYSYGISMLPQDTAIGNNQLWYLKRRISSTFEDMINSPIPLEEYIFSISK